MTNNHGQDPAPPTDATLTSIPTVHVERPIQSAAEDKLQRQRFVERLTAALINKSTGASSGVVIGITGPWGSGKSSVLNLLQQHIATKYENALVVRFDPWLVTGRDDLIAEFIGELIGTINANEKLKQRFAPIVTTIAEYGAQLAPLAGLLTPPLAVILRGGDAVKSALSKRKSLAALRSKLVNGLEKISSPVIVLIDEIDRVEDNEIRTVAQLVRSVADFPRISYVLAYDPERVVQALGGGDRGRGYLEKIVQFQIPLPIAFEDEIGQLISADLVNLQAELDLPDNFRSVERYQKLMQILTSCVVRTPRDVGRLIGTFHAVAGMLKEEVDWIDLLAYSALLTKAPAVVANMRRSPDDFLETPLSQRGVLRKIDREKLPLDQRLSEIMPPSEDKEIIEPLLEFLFPFYSENPSRQIEHRDAMAHQRPLLTTLRLGLLPNAYSRSATEQLIRNSPEEIEASLRRAYEDDGLAQLIERLDDVYSDLVDFNHVTFWQGVARFARKADCEWMTFYQPMHEVIHSLSQVLEYAVRRKPELRGTATSVFSNLRSANEDELTAFWLRTHMFVWGLFGHEKAGGAWFLNEEQTTAMAREMSIAWRPHHIAGTLVPCRWDLQPIYTMIETGIWDDICRAYLEKMLKDDRGLDGFTLMLYGASYRTDKDMIAKMCPYDSYIQRVRERLDSDTISTVHETVRAALSKAIGRRS
jgi:predicted KAP-like P-loop ATPase